jgi:hypothetical protein
VGFFAPAFWEGINQLMLILTPTENRTSFVAWNFTIIGVVSSGGAYMGGIIKDRTEGIHIHVTNSFSLTNIHFILLISVFLLIVTMIVLSFIKEETAKDMSFVVNRIARPGIFRTYISMSTLSGTKSSVSVAKALRSIENYSQDLVLNDVIERLSDPDSDVRDEAASALGRIGAYEAVHPLIMQLQDKNSTIRSQAAKALGKIGHRDALTVLLEGLSDSSEDVQNACTLALGSMGDVDSVQRLLSIIKNIGSDRLAASGAEAASKLGAIEAVWEIVPRIHNSENPVLSRQLGIALANLLGESGHFYKYVTGKSSSRESNISALFTEASKDFPSYLKRIKKVSTPQVLKNSISKKIKALKKQFDEEHFLASYQLLKECVFLITDYLVEPEENERNYFRKLYLMDRKTALWWWFIEESSYLVQDASEEVVKIDILIGIYFLIS